MSQTGIVSTHFSTSELAPRDQFDAWHECISVIFDVENQSEHALGGFGATVDAFQLADVIVAVSCIDAERYKRSDQRIRRDQIDHLQFSLYRLGGWDCESTTGPVQGKARQICVVDLAQPLVSHEPRSDMISVIVPREKLESRLPGIAALHGRVPVGPFAELLVDYFDLLAKRLPGLPASSGEELASATCDMLVACLRPSLNNMEIAQPHLDAVLLRRAKNYIDRELSSPNLSPDSVASFLGVSRRTLYRLFENIHGVQKFILARRLDKVRQALADSEHPRKVSDVAAGYGFTRADYFSRAFKSRFGLSPAEARGMRVQKAANPSTQGGGLSSDGFDCWIKELGK
ncbi:helix-turn-helix domain-containing protein [Mesorhizobium sp. LHD-90]|uniref:helix-turn-helix domain-containing protein n=1 Tax=Mesorhizobium sp. LHD-90 TaxID=3071414 RepID=UPI0027DF4343|nr:helix-turn-helix domain-containing protein [Mesorhizobium sp. LHD-90]MDQ6436384.1 helix-turn-helix domain-containing protein [Mesorhizobium sp. LHD-90]